MLTSIGGRIKMGGPGVLAQVAEKRYKYTLSGSSSYACKKLHSWSESGRKVVLATSDLIT